MKAVILGCGRVGAGLAMKLAELGNAVSIIDKNPDSFRRLSASYKGNQIRGLGIDEDVLRKAGIEEADAFIALTNGDNTNVMSAQMAKVLFKVPRVFARVYDPVRAYVYHDMGIQTICTTSIGVGLFLDLLHDVDVSSFDKYFSIFGDPSTHK
jgi:trk system potassium uptake protein TrkA